MNNSDQAALNNPGNSALPLSIQHLLMDRNMLIRPDDVSQKPESWQKVFGLNGVISYSGLLEDPGGQKHVEGRQRRMYKIKVHTDIFLPQYAIGYIEADPRRMVLELITVVPMMWFLTHRTGSVVFSSCRQRIPE